MDLEDLKEVLDGNPRLMPLIVRLQYAAGMNGYDKTLMMLAGFLGDALSDSSKIDEAATMMAAVENLGPAHVQVLELMTKDASDVDPTCARGDVRWNTGRLTYVMNMRPELVILGVQGLLNAGFISDTGFDGGGANQEGMGVGGTTFAVTGLGATVLHILSEMSEASA